MFSELGNEVHFAFTLLWSMKDAHFPDDYFSFSFATSAMVYAGRKYCFIKFGHSYFTSQMSKNYAGDFLYVLWWKGLQFLSKWWW